MLIGLVPDPGYLDVLNQSICDVGSMELLEQVMKELECGLVIHFTSPHAGESQQSFLWSVQS